MNPNFGLWLCRSIVFLGAILMAAGALIAPHFSSKIDAKKDSKIDELVNGNRDLMYKNDELMSKITKYQTDIEIKNERIRQLEIDSKKASRGISSIYDFDGVRRTTLGPGQMSTIVGEETDVFQELVKMRQEEKFPEVIKLCEDQIVKTPEWLTPYLFLGIAYASLGNKEMAIKYLEWVVEKAPGDPNYAKAASILEKLKGK